MGILLDYALRSLYTVNMKHDLKDDLEHQINVLTEARESLRELAGFATEKNNISLLYILSWQVDSMLQDISSLLRKIDEGKTI